jgi:hypothetical protein
MKPQKILKNLKEKTLKKWSIAIRIIPILLIVAVLKLISHKFGFEVMELNALFTSLVAGTIFLIGFLISGVLTDFKESEKLPSELAASLRTLYDDTYTICKSKRSETAYKFIEYQQAFLNPLIKWFYKNEKTLVILDRISSMNDYFAELDKEGIQANYIIKLKNEQNNLRKMILRIHTIRDTEFIGSAYAIVEIMGFLIALGLLIIKIEPFQVSLFFTLLLTFLITYMIYLIKDLDNPFDYKANGETGTEVPLKPLHDLNGTMKIP